MKSKFTKRYSINWLIGYLVRKGYKVVLETGTFKDLQFPNSTQTNNVKLSPKMIDGMMAKQILGNFSLSFEEFEYTYIKAHRKKS